MVDFSLLLPWDGSNWYYSAISFLMGESKTRRTEHGFSCGINFKEIMQSCFFPYMVSPAELFSVSMLSPCVIHNHSDWETQAYGCEYPQENIDPLLWCKEMNALTLDLYSQNQTTQQTCLMIPPNPVILTLGENHKKLVVLGPCQSTAEDCW